MTTSAKMEMKVSVPFASERLAEIAFNTLRVEVEPSRSKVTRCLAVDGANLVANFTATEIRNLRVSVNSFFEHLVLISETVRQFG